MSNSSPTSRNGEDTPRMLAAYQRAIAAVEKIPAGSNAAEILRAALVPVFNEGEAIERELAARSETEDRNKDHLWAMVRLAAEDSDWNRDADETLQEWAFRTLTRNRVLK